MKVLILSCNTGEGHNSAGKAIKYYFEQNGDECHMVDTLAFWSEKMSKLIASGHVFIYTRTPKMFDIVYNGAEIFAKKETSKHDSVLFKLFARGAKNLYDYIIAGGFERIVCFHPFASQMLTKVLRDHPELQIPTYLVATDYTCSPGAGESKMDVYIIPHPTVADEFIKRGVPRAKIVPIGIPINNAYTSLPDKKTARVMLELPENDKIVLLMCGSMGCGPIEKIAESIAGEMGGDATLVIVCGRNERLYNELVHLSEKNKKVRVLGFTDKMPVYMSAADLFVTKPGGLSSTEAACVHLPMVMIDAVAGCETYNLNFFANNGFALTSENVEGIVTKTLGLLFDSESLERMRSKLAENFSADTAYKIYSYVKEGKRND